MYADKLRSIVCQRSGPPFDPFAWRCGRDFEIAGVPQMGRSCGVVSTRWFGNSRDHARFPVCEGSRAGGGVDQAYCVSPAWRASRRRRSRAAPIPAFWPRATPASAVTCSAMGVSPISNAIVRPSRKPMDIGYQRIWNSATPPSREPNCIGTALMHSWPLPEPVDFRCSISTT